MSFTSDIKKARLLLSGRYPRDQITVKSLLWDDSSHRIEAFHSLSHNSNYFIVREVVAVSDTACSPRCEHFVRCETSEGRTFEYPLHDLCGPSTDDPLDHVTTPSFDQ